MSTDHRQIPPEDSDFGAWLEALCTRLQAAGAAADPEEVSLVQGALEDWRKVYGGYVDARNAAREMELRKDAARFAAENLVRKYAAPSGGPGSGVVALPRGAAGAATPQEVPLISLDSTRPGTVRVHVGTAPWNESANRMAENATYMILEFRQRPVKGEPGPWEFLTMTRRSPYNHVLPELDAEPTEYRACYVSATGRRGQWSTSVCSVSAASA
jgi:hypothetical protein